MVYFKIQISAGLLVNLFLAVSPFRLPAARGRVIRGYRSFSLCYSERTPPKGGPLLPLTERSIYFATFSFEGCNLVVHSDPISRKILSTRVR
jgi:hypothetical protein